MNILLDKKYTCISARYHSDTRNLVNLSITFYLYIIYYRICIRRYQYRCIYKELLKWTVYIYREQSEDSSLGLWLYEFYHIS